MFIENPGKYHSYNLDSSWGSGANSQRISELLSKPDCTLEELLDEDTFLSEVREGNTQLFQL